jgi:SecD/SecF fusion protein
MKRFSNRIIVCLVPVLVSLAVVIWAVREYQNGRGGFRMGVDLAGGTILVYEVDETKMPAEGFKAEDLAAALKRRIDPADLYAITIRPVQGTPPRVEIILPTGGQHQAEADQRNWNKILTDAAAKFPGDGKEDPYKDVPRNNNFLLTEAIAKANPKVDREEISNWVDSQTKRGKKERRLLTSEQVENIKADIERQGRLEFRILANNQDDRDAIVAARAWFADKENRAELEKLQQRNEPPPQPRNKEDNNSVFFKVNLPGSPNEPPHSYSWVEVGKSELYTLGLNSAALAKPSKTALREMVEKARADGTTFDYQGALFYSRKITDWSRRLVKDRELAKQYEFFMLVRDPIKGQEITGDYLVSAREGQSNEGAKRAIHFAFNAEGGNLFYDVTSKNKPSSRGGFKRQLAIIFDGQVLSAPSLNEPIRTNGQITGDFTPQELTDYVRFLRAGALPATLKKDPVSQNSMGATLGADTIRKGTSAIFWAFVAVMAFMVFYYRFAGMVACTALLANLLLTVAFMVVVQAAFTLPGLAGLVLMLGMAVDANVLIYERLREERERGASLAMALRNGYDRAFPTIIDTHLSSIFTAIVLYVVGNDQLKGFGISLTVGLIISLFTSLYMTRTIFEVCLAKNWLKDLRFGRLKFGKLDLHHANFDFMAIRYYWFTATLILTVLGAALFIYRLDRGGLNIDFVGGTAYTAQLNRPMSMDELRAKLEKGEALPDQSIEQVFVDNDQGAKPGESRFFTVRTSEKSEDSIKKVLAFVNSRLGDDLKRINLVLDKDWDKVINKSNTEAKLIFVNQQGESDFASPAQVQMLFSNELAAMGLPRTSFQIDKVQDLGKEKGGHYSELILKLNEPMDRAKFKQLLTTVQKDFADSAQPERLENFDRQLAANTQQRALYAILASWAAILLYLWFRFGSWTFGAAAVLCLIHDLFFTLGAIAACHFVHNTWFFGTLLGIQDFKIDLPSVAALLTLVGYSVSDTIVVFDRIREVRGKNPLLTPKIINDSVNQTLSRTLLASMTVWVVVIVLYFFGGEGVKLFAFVMVVGVIVGTYSSIYIASPLLLIFGEGAGRDAAERRAAAAAAARG